jgi:hypothetical protein
MGVRPKAALCLTVLAAGLGLAACGGDGDRSTASSEVAASQSTATAPSPNGSPQGSTEPQKPASRPSTPPEPSSPPTPGFKDTSGKTHIPAFGVEASDNTRTGVQAVLDAYLRAARAGDWKKVCSYLYGTNKAELQKISGRRGGCGKTFPSLLKRYTADRQPYFGPARLSGLRIKAGTSAGFALFHGTDGNDYWVAMKREGGQWKIISALPQPLSPPSG